MAILGTGIDIVEVDRLEETIVRRGERLLDRVFTPAERAYCDQRPRPVMHYAGRFAVKEAVLKAIRTGWVQGIGWKDIEVELGAGGEPSVRLTGGALARANEMGIENIHISISHTERYAVASAVAEGRPDA
ncbi:MAG TPA: holo-ACP synthase [Planctomycetota bacterium]|nr:holo-ACP synthase [Planctomycetota bacterium]HRR79742.1 holo-ACP synthase [Planctomycetota bacterium]HRT95844.1 holo-ACP synthase [Planctomycetota bacterium]